MPGNKSRFSNTLIFISLFLVLFIDGLGISIVLPLFANLFLIPETSILSSGTTSEMRNFMYGLSLLSFSLGMFFGAPVLGELSDKYGRKKILLYSLWGTCGGYVLSGIGIALASPLIFILGRVIDGLTAGSIPVAQAVILDISPEEKKMGNLGFVLFAITSGYILGPLMSGLLSDSALFGLSTPFYTTAMISVISIICLRALRETHVSNPEKKINWLTSLSTLALLKKVGNVKGLIFSFLCFQLGWTMYFQYIPHFLSRAEFSEYIVKILALVGLGMTISFCFLTRLLQKHFSSVQLILAACVAVTVSITGTIIPENSMTTLMSASLLGSLGYALGYSALMAYLSRNVSKNLQGLMMGIAASMSALSAVITALLGSLIVNISYFATFVFSCFCFIACFLVISISSVRLESKVIATDDRHEPSNQ